MADMATSVGWAPPATRLSLRAPATSRTALSAALGLALPDAPKTSNAAGSRATLWLGPDEWLVVDESEADLAGLCAETRVLHSAVDISHRNVALLVSGPAVEAVLNAGCPQDLSQSVFPAGACSRTVLGKIEIVLWRTSQTNFRVECQRSYASYASALLTRAASMP